MCVGTNSSLQLLGFMLIDSGIYHTKISNIYLQFSSSPRYLLKVAELFEKLRVREVLEKKKSVNVDDAVSCYIQTI